MGLIKCSECRREISDKAKSCPNCGCPIGKITIGGNIETLFEERIKVYVNNGYRMITQSDNHAEFRKSNPINYILFVLVLPIIMGVIGYSGSYSSKADNTSTRQVFEASKAALKTQYGITYFFVALVIGICVLIAIRGKDKVIIRINKIGKIEEIGNVLKKK